MRLRLLYYFLVLLQLTFIANAQKQKPVVFEDVTLIDGWNTTARKNSYIVVQGEKIVTVGKLFEIVIPEKSTKINLTGKYVIPGLIDIDARFHSEDDLAAMFAAGVTTANLVTPFTERLPLGKHTDTTRAKQIPELYVTVPFPANGLDWHSQGKDTMNPLYLKVPASPEEAREQIRLIAETGTKRICVMYDNIPGCAGSESGIDSATFRAIVDEAKRRRMHVNVQASRSSTFPTILDARISILSGGVYDRRITSDEVERVGGRPTYYLPTLTKYQMLTEGSGFIANAMNGAGIKTLFPSATLKQYLEPEYGQVAFPQCTGESLLKNNLSIVFDNAGAIAKNFVPTPVGTAMPVLPGAGMHLELENLVKAGLAPIQAITSATSISADCLGIRDRIGFIYRNFQADFLVLDKNPVEDIRNTRSISMIIKNGKIYDVKKLRSAQ